MKIVEDLRHRVVMCDRGNGNVTDEPDELCQEAANVIECLRDFLLEIDQNPRSWIKGEIKQTLESKMTNTLVWVSHGETESGDTLDLIVWSKQPTKAQVDAVYREKYPQEYDEVGHVCLKISEASMR